MILNPVDVRGGQSVCDTKSYTLTACLHYAAERFWNGSYCSVNGCGTVLKQTIPGGTVPPRVGGPNRSRTVPFASVNETVPVERFLPLVSHVVGRLPCT